jgi:Tfp pilus assembly protein PilX
MEPDMKRRMLQLRDDSGAALIMVIGWSMVLAMLVTAAVGYAIQTTKVARNGQEWGSAQSAAMAGIEDYVARLNRNDNYGRIWDCTNAALQGPNQPGNTCGWTSATAPGWLPVVGSDPNGPTFHYDVDASMLDKNGTITVTSTGRVGKETRTVQAAIGRGGSTDFLYYTDLEHADPANETVYPTPPTKYFCGSAGAQKDIYWWSPAIGGYTRSNSGCTEIGFASGDVLDGRVHFNDTPKLNAAGTQFKAGFETGAPGCKTATGPSYAGCLRSGSPIPVYGAPPVFSDPLYLDDTSAKFATYPGCHYYGATRIKFNSNGTMTVWSKDSAGRSTGAGCGTFTAANLPQTVNVPNDQVIYVSSSGSVHRCLSGEIGDGLPLGTYTGSSTTAYSYDLTMLLNAQFCGQGNMYIEGTVKGRVTMAAENSIVATGDLVLADGINGTDLVGLVAGNSVSVFHPWVDDWKSSTTNTSTCLVWNYDSKGKKTTCKTYQTTTTWGWDGTPSEVGGWPKRYTDPGTGSNNPADGIQIAASIQTLQHSFYVQQYNKGSDQGTLLVQGSIAQRWRGIVGTSGGTGYTKNYKYDARLKYSSPPYFPQWTNAKWGPRHTGELVSPYNAAGAYVG